MADFNMISASGPKGPDGPAGGPGGAGAQAKAVLATRLAGGDPPDSFQVHAGLEVEK